MNAEQLLHDVLERDASTQPPLPNLYARSVASGRRRAQRHRAAWAAGVVVLLVAALIPALRLGRPSAAPGDQPLQPTLRALADRVRALPAEPVHTTGAWFVQRMVDEPLHPAVQHRSDEWWLPDGYNEVVVSGQRVGSGAGPALTWEALRRLPLDPTALAKELRTNTTYFDLSLQPDLQLFVNAGQLLTYTPADPQLRAAILEALAQDPHVQVQGFVQDAERRRALSLSVSVADPADPSQQDVEGLLVSTVTGRAVGDSGGATESFLATQWVPTDHAYPTGTTPQPLASSPDPGVPDPTGSTPSDGSPSS